MITAKMPMPGALRLRDVFALKTADCSCDLVYDIERGVVLEVPFELQAHVALALERTEPDDEVLSWLIREDLLTSEPFAAWWPEEEDAGFGGGFMGSPLRGDRESILELDRPTEAEALEALDPLFRPGQERRVRLHLYWPEEFPGVDALAAISAEASRRAAGNRQPVSFELTLALSAFDRRLFRFLARENLSVRVEAGPLPAGDAGARQDLVHALAPLARCLADRLTLRLQLGRGARLADAWALAEEASLLHQDVAWAPGSAPA